MAEPRTFAGPMLRAAARTHPGRVRANNEDVPLVDAARGVFGVIDGIGGHAGGEIAAAMAKDVIVQRLARPLGAPADRVREAIAIANNEIFKRAADSSDLAGMACVITLALVSDGRLTIGHVGDARLYKLRAGGIRKLTRDHSPVGEREDAGELSEADAMRHPHRNEVFRDVGTVFRDKDEQEFVDIIDEPLEPDAAILLCTDGLSDMLPGSTIAHIVRQHAGSPEQVVEALVAAANDAGGRDNITAVYAEMPLFADALAGGAGQRLTPTEPAGGNAAQPDRNAMAMPAAPAHVGRARRAARAVVSSRMTWFAAGAVVGVIGALALTMYVATTQVRAPRTLIVAPGRTSSFTSITAAIASASPGDVVRVEPGVYREVVEVRDGIDLVASRPGTVTIVASADAARPPLSIVGALNVRIAGIRIEAEKSAEIGVRITAPEATLELVEIVGPFRHAFALSPGSSISVRGSRIAVTGTLLAVPDDGHATFVNSILMRTATTALSEPAISASPSAHLVLRGNVFNGFGSDIVEGVTEAQRAQLVGGNTVVAAGRGGPGVSEPAAGRGSSVPRSRTPRGGR